MKDSSSNKLLLIGMVLVLSIASTMSGAFIIRGITTESAEEPDSSISEESVEPEYKAYNFQPAIDTFVQNTTGNRSVLIYDIERKENVGSYNVTEAYGTASLYKLFVVYEGYRRLENGIWDANSVAGSTGRTILDCLDLAIRESYSPCAETLWAMIGHSELDTIIKNDFKITNSNISNLVSNTEDIMSMMLLFYNHPDIKNETYIARIKDSFLNQPITTYNWRQGLPSGFTRTNVYNKVGWDYNPSISNWNIYHDAAILEFPEENRHFAIVVMTNRVPFQKISELGSAIENLYYNN
jgi:hypothetical protein